MKKERNKDLEALRYKCTVKNSNYRCWVNKSLKDFDNISCFAINPLKGVENRDEVEASCKFDYPTIMVKDEHGEDALVVVNCALSAASVLASIGGGKNGFIHCFFDSEGVFHSKHWELFKSNEEYGKYNPFIKVSETTNTVFGITSVKEISMDSFIAPIVDKLIEVNLNIRKNIEKLPTVIDGVANLLSGNKIGQSIHMWQKSAEYDYCAYIYDGYVDIAKRREYFLRNFQHRLPKPYADKEK